MTTARRPTVDTAAPGREDWPDPEPSGDAGKALTDVILTTFRLNGRLMEAAQDMATEGELTAAWWQVIGGVLDEPQTVAAIGRRMGVTRQGVQRIADLLVERGLAEYRTNPAHRRTKLLACTEAGYWAVRRISYHSSSTRGPSASGARSADELRAAHAVMQRLVDVLEAERPWPARQRERSDDHDGRSVTVARSASRIGTSTGRSRRLREADPRAGRARRQAMLSECESASRRESTASPPRTSATPSATPYAEPLWTTT